LSTLKGLIDYLHENPDELELNDLLIHIEDPETVKLYSSLYDGVDRTCYIVSNALLPQIILNNFYDIEKFNIMLQSCFVQTENTANVLKCTGNIKEQNVRDTSDDGISQIVTAKQGIASVKDVVVPNPVLLAPFRTFSEVAQPESRFVLRMQDGPRAALYEADGGQWRIEAIENIFIYLNTELSKKEISVKIIS